MPSFSLTAAESQVLYFKYRKLGLNSEEAGKKIKNIKDYLRKMVLKLIKKDKSNIEIDRIFKQKFYEECMKAEI